MTHLIIITAAPQRRATQTCVSVGTLVVTGAVTLGVTIPDRLLRTGHFGLDYIWSSLYRKKILKDTLIYVFI